ncbi:MAG: glycosyltransferase family 1 protein [Anaerolineae bacterium]
MMKSRKRTSHHREQHGSPSLTEVFGADYRFHFDPAHLAPIKRVALFAETFFPRYDGVAQHSYRTLRYLQQTGREVLIFAPDNAPTRIENSRVIPLSSVGVPRYSGLRAGLPSPEIARQLAHFKPDLIQLFSPAIMSLRAISFGHKRRIPTLANYETNLSQYMPYYGLPWLKGAARGWQRMIHNRCDLTLVPTLAVQEQLQQARFQRLACWACGVNEQRFNPNHRTDEWRNRLLNGRPAESLLCIYVGRLAAEKNIMALLDIARMQGVALTIIGDGPQQAALEKMFSGTGTQFMGRLLGDDLAHAYASADVFTFPSHTETFGLVTLEAMASGLPVVVSDQGGARNFVVDGVAGYLCHSQQAFNAAVEQLRDNAHLRAQMGQQARRAAEGHCFSAIMAQLEDHYRQVLNKRRSASNDS